MNSLVNFKTEQVLRYKFEFNHTYMSQLNNILWFELYTYFRTNLDDTGMYDMAYWLEDFL